MGVLYLKAPAAAGARPRPRAPAAHATGPALPVDWMDGGGRSVMNQASSFRSQRRRRADRTSQPHKEGRKNAPKEHLAEEPLKHLLPAKAPRAAVRAAAPRPKEGVAAAAKAAALCVWWSGEWVQSATKPSPSQPGPNKTSPTKARTGAPPPNSCPLKKKRVPPPPPPPPAPKPPKAPGSNPPPPPPPGPPPPPMPAEALRFFEGEGKGRGDDDGGGGGGGGGGNGG